MAVDPSQLIDVMADAFRRGDFAAFQHALREDTELVLEGESRYAGTYVGVGQVLAFIAKLHGLTRAESLRIHRVDETPSGLEIELGLAIRGREGLEEERVTDTVTLVDGLVLQSHMRAVDDQGRLDRLLDAHHAAQAATPDAARERL
jgi:hypothetical protein